MGLADKLKKRAAPESEPAEASEITIKIPKYPKRQDLDAPKPYVRRAAGGQWLPGSVPNPQGSGRAVALSKAVAELTGGGQEMIDLLGLIMRGDLKVEVVTAKGDLVEVGPTIKERMEAMDRLLDRMAGKAPAVLSIENGANGEAGSNPLESASPEVKLKALELFAAMHVEKQGDTVDGEVIPARQAEGSSQEESKSEPEKDPTKTPG